MSGPRPNNPVTANPRASAAPGDAAPTLPRAPLVVKIGGAALDDPAAAIDLWRAIREVHAFLDGRLILIHGGGKAVDRQLDRLGLVSERRDGIRITPPEHLDEVTGILAGRVNKAIVGAIQSLGVRAVGLCLSDGLTARCAKAEHYGFDPGRVGTVIGGDPALLEVLLSERFLPVLCSIGLDDEGLPLNINADDAAAAIAGLVRASGLVLLTDVAGVLATDGRLIADITAPEIDRLIAAGTIRGGMIPKVAAAARAADLTGIPTTIASFNDPANLLRLAKGQSAGTRITPGSPRRTIH